MTHLRSSLRASAVTLGLAAGLWAPEASAFEAPFTKSSVSASGGLGFGAWLGEGELNAYGFGLNARGGYTLPMNLYLGARFDYHFGEKEEFFGGDIRGKTWMLQGEVGYDLGLLPILVLRPKVGFGPMQVRAKACLDVADSCSDPEVETSASLALGLEAPISLGPVFVSPESRFNFFFDDADATGLLFAVNAGVTF